MERLTYRIYPSREAFLAHGLDAIWSKKLKKLRYDIITKAVDRLAAYEDTGLTPEQIQQQEMRIEYLLEHGEGQEGRIKALEYLLWGTIPILEVANEHELITKINNLLEDAEQE